MPKRWRKSQNCHQQRNQKQFNLKIRKMEKKFIKANNYDQAVKELAAVDKDVAEKLSDEINANDHNHFVVVLVRKNHNEAAKRYDIDINIQQFDSRSYENAKDRLDILGYDKMIVLHTPDGVTTDTAAAEATPVINMTQPAAAPAKSAAEIEAEIEERANEKARKLHDEWFEKFNSDHNARTAAAAAKSDPEPKNTTASASDPNAVNGTAAAATQGSSKTEEDPKKQDLTLLKTAEMKEFAAKNEIDIKGKAKGDEILKALQEWQKAK